VQAGGVEATSPAGVGQTRFDVAMPLASLPPRSAATLAVTAATGGNVVASSPLAFETPPPLPPDRDHRGARERRRAPEARQQEFVELRNPGSDAVVSWGGLPAGGTPRAATILPARCGRPDGYAQEVVVPATDAAKGQDPGALRAGDGCWCGSTARHGADGASANGGEAGSADARLVTVVSSYGGWVWSRQG
jgi:hypothetical protein